MRWMALLLFLIFSITSFAQKKSATISGKVVDEDDRPISGVSVVILGHQNGINTSDSGTFRMQVPAEKAFALVFSHTGFHTVQKNFLLNEGEHEVQTIRLLRSDKTLETVVIRDEKDRNETGLVRMNPKNAITLPSVTGGVEGLIKVLVGSNNELTSQYSVRGGNYDENLIYINDFEIFRPYLVRNGQQEGLSFINPELVKNINFYNGGFQAKFGDKISSVLEINYKEPKKFGGSAYVSLLEQGLSLEGGSKKKDLSWLIGIRSKTNRNLLSSQETKGNYLPSAADLQAYLTWKLNQKLKLEVLGIMSMSDFKFVPESAQKSTAVFSPLFTANLGLDIYFEGSEHDRYRNNLLGLALEQSVNSKVKLKWMASRYGDEETENFDILGAYLFGERSFDKTQPGFGQILNPLGAGVFHNFARNQLNIEVYNVSHKGSAIAGKHFLQWGVGVDHTVINDKVNEWERNDSAGYSVPFDPNSLQMTYSVRSKEDLAVNKYQGYLQDNIRLNANSLSLQAGVRFNYNDLNGEFLVSPRAQISFKPDWNRDVIFKAAAGVYDQPPFYREYRRPDGTINKDLKSQKSIQFVAGMDYNVALSDRPLRITTEAYYKKLSDVVSYDLENVRIRYSGENDARAYAMGIETRIYTELVKDAQSWLSINFSRTMEDLNDDHYFLYKNAEGEIIDAQTTDQVIADSVRQDVGWVRRPSDRLFTVGMFLQDYLSTNKNFKVHVNLIYGSNMTYNVPNSARYRNALIIDPYFRVDVGFSALLLSEKSMRRNHSPFRSFDNIWASLEVFNIIDRSNVISYQLIKDFANNTFSIPNRLTPRLVNVKLLARF